MLIEITSSRNTNNETGGTYKHEESRRDQRGVSMMDNRKEIKEINRGKEKEEFVRVYSNIFVTN